MDRLCSTVLFCFILLSFPFESSCQKINIPLTKAPGSGPFSQVFINLYPRPQQDPLDTLYEKANGLPSEYSYLQKGIYYTNYPQMMYTAYKSGIADSISTYQVLNTFRTNAEDLTYYTNDYVDGQISIAFGENQNKQK